MKILVLGGTSFFGKEFAIKSFKDGNNVTVFSRKCPIDGIPLDIKQVRGDRTVEIDLVRMSIDKWDIIVDNLCYWPEDAEKSIKAFNGRTGLYIFTSSEAVYSALESATSPFREIQTELFKENQQLKKSDLYSYAFGKLQAEKVFLKAYREKKFPVAIIRFPIVIGPNDPTLRPYSYWMRIADSEPFFAPGLASSRRYIFSKDTARAFNLIICGKKVLGEIFNFGDSSTMSLEDFLKISATIMNKKLNLAYPDFQWLERNNFNFDASPFSCLSDYIIDISKVEKEFAWKSTDVHTWLKETINWFFFKYVGPKPDNYSNRKDELALIQKWGEENI
jgi:nucleoside-diphosphate-sugar epimerase